MNIKRTPKHQVLPKKMTELEISFNKFNFDFKLNFLISF